MAKLMCVMTMQDSKHVNNVNCTNMCLSMPKNSATQYVVHIIIMLASGYIMDNGIFLACLNTTTQYTHKG